MLVKAIQDALFIAVGKIESRTSKTHSDQSWLNYSIYSSFFLYLIVQGFIMVFDWGLAADLAQTTILVFCAKYVTQKLGELFFCYHKVRNPQHLGSKNTFYAVKNYIALKFFNIDMTSTTFQFNFFKEASRVFPLVAMNFAFLANGSNSIKGPLETIPKTIPITMVTLYIGALCDKYRLITQPEPCKFNSASFMIKLFKFFRVDHFAFWFGGIIWLLSFDYYLDICRSVIFTSFSYINPIRTTYLDPTIDNMDKFIGVVIILMGGAYLFYLVVWPTPDSLETKYDAHFEQQRGLVPYDTVASYFTDTYKKPIYSENIQRSESINLIL